MKGILVFFIILLGSILLGLQLNHDPGYVLIAINHWTIETTVWVFMFGVLALFFLSLIFLHIFHQVANTPKTLIRWHRQRLTQKAQAITRQGLIEYSEGYWQKAQTHLIQALPNTETPLLNYLTAAKAAQKMGNSQLRDHYLREAQQSMPEARIAVELTQAQLQLANHQWEQALATLRHLQDLAPRHPYVLKLLMRLYEQVRDWPQLIALLPSLKKHKVITQPMLDRLEQKAYLARMQELEKQNQDHAVTQFYQSLPKSLINNAHITAEYIRFLINIQNYDQAKALLKAHVGKEFNEELIALYNKLPCDESQLAFCESLLKKNPHSVALYLCLGRLCVAQHLWGKAKNYLEQALELNNDPEAHMELGQLHEQLNDPVLAGIQYKKGLDAAINV